MSLPTLLLLTPLVGAILVALVPDDRDELARALATLHATAAALLAAAIVSAWDPVVGGVQLTERHVWSRTLNAAYEVGVDGPSVAMVALTAVLFLVAILGSTGVTTRPRAYLAWILALEVPTLGVFVARDWTFFYACWELTLIPLFFLISLWGGPRRDAASLTFLLYTMAGSVFLLLGTLALVLLGAAHGAFPGDGSLLAPTTQRVIAVAMVVGFAVKVPVVPLHGWLPLAHVEAPAPVSVLLSGVLLKMGAYGILRTFEALPEGAVFIAPALALLGLFGVVHGALLAWRQTDLKAIVAWSSVSHMGFVLVALATLDAVGVRAALLQMVAHGLVAGATFLSVGLVYDRTHDRSLGTLAGLTDRAPWLAGLVIVAFLASMAAPGTAGFVGEIAAVAAGFERLGVAVGIALLGSLVWAAAALRVVVLTVGRRRAPHGHGHGPDRLPDLDGPERTAAALLLAGIVLIGLRPSLVTDLVPLDAGAAASPTASAEPGLASARESLP